MKRLICAELPNPDEPAWTVIRKLDRASEAAGWGKSVRSRIKARVAGAKGIAPAPTILDELISLKSGLQDALLTGRVRVSEAIIEGAAEA